MISKRIVAAAAAVATIAGTHAFTNSHAADCVTARHAVIVNLPNHRDGDVLRHAWAAIRRGQPETVHIDRADADRHRTQSLRGIPTWGQLTAAERREVDPQHPGEPHDRDEWPCAACEEGGRGADIRYIESDQNRSAGSLQGSQLAPYCGGQAWRYERKPGPKPH